MSVSCCGHQPDRNPTRGWRAALWAALIVNAVMFVVEFSAGSSADSHALRADALDFFADAANYAISLLVAGLTLSSRARAAMFKGVTLVLLGLWVCGSTTIAALTSATPQPQTMGLVGALALIVNVGVALMLYRFRSGDANMRSVWICSRNDSIGNVAVVLAAGGVFGTGTAWPDLGVAAAMAVLGVWGGWQIINQARAELRDATLTAIIPAE
jgi:Co/Zn/Cd efflux system component